MPSAADEQLIVGYHDTKLSAISNIGRVIPGPLYFADKREFLTTWAAQAALNTQIGLETTAVDLVAFWLSGFSDDPETPAHSPLTTLVYQIYVFKEYGLERKVEATEDVASLDRRQLKVYRDFVQVVLDMKAAYQGDINLGVHDPAIYVKSFSRPVENDTLFETQAECLLVPNVIGLAAQFSCEVALKLKEC